MTIIAQFRVEGFKRISVVEIRPDGNVVRISGRNGQGKTSLMDAIASTFGGKDLAPSQPIKKGRREAEITATMDDGTKITRRFWLTDGDNQLQSTLKIEAADGMPVTKAQTFLDNKLGALTFNPLDFAERMKPKQQYDLMRSFVSGFDFDQNAADRQKVFDARTAANRRCTNAIAAANLVTLPAGAVPRIESAGDLSNQLSAAISFNAEIDARAERRESAARELEELETQIEQLQARATTLRRKIETAEPLPEKMDVEQIKQALESIEANNEAARAAIKREQLISEADEAQLEADKFAQRIKDLDKAKADAIAKAKMPVDGLSFGDGEILLGGIPFSDASGRDRLTTSIAVGMALNPSIRVMLVDEASSLDEEGLGIVYAMAEKNGFQVWLVRVAPDAGVGFIIEDGRVKGA